MLVWRGREIVDRMALAQERAGNSILSDCVIESKNTVPVKTTALQGSIRMEAMRMTSATRMSGFFGSWGIAYALPVEEGSKPHIIRPKVKKALWWEGLAHPVRFVRHPGTKARPYLRPAADKYFPQFAQRIREEFARG